MRHADAGRTTQEVADAHPVSVEWDGFNAGAIAERCAVPHVELLGETASTMDVAHALAEEGALSGTVVLADSQSAGRGRLGRSWASPSGRGVWLTLIEHPSDPAALDVLSLRIGMRAAEALDAFSDGRVGIKWPNDLVVCCHSEEHSDEESAGQRQLAGLKLGGILVEARWTGKSLGWVCAGIGVNVLAPDVSGASGLRSDVQRVDVLAALVRATRSAAAAAGPLTSQEIDRYRARDVLAGRDVVSPAVGRVVGIDGSGALIVDTTRGREQYRTGTIRLAEDS